MISASTHSLRPPISRGVLRPISSTPHSSGAAFRKAAEVAAALRQLLRCFGMMPGCLRNVGGRTAFGSPKMMAFTLRTLPRGLMNLVTHGKLELNISFNPFLFVFFILFGVYRSELFQFGRSCFK